MKAVVAIIKPINLSAIHDGLHAIGIDNITPICEALKHRHKKGHSETSHSLEHGGHYRARLRVEVIVSDEFVKQVIELISSAASGDIPDNGTVYVHALDQVLHI